MRASTGLHRPRYVFRVLYDVVVFFFISIFRQSESTLLSGFYFYHLVWGAGEGSLLLSGNPLFATKGSKGNFFMGTRWTKYNYFYLPVRILLLLLFFFLRSVTSYYPSS